MVPFKTAGEGEQELGLFGAAGPSVNMTEATHWASIQMAKSHTWLYAQV